MVVSGYWPIIPVIAGFFLALLLPSHVLSEYPMLREITGAVKSVFAPISGYAQRSRFPQVAECYFTFMWLLAPYYFWVALVAVRNNEGMIGWKPKSLRERLSVFSVGVGLIGLLGLFVLFFNPGFDFNLLPINSSRVALGLVGWAFSGSGGAFLLAVSWGIGERVLGRRQRAT